MSKVDPLVRGIYYLYLLNNNLIFPLGVVHDHIALKTIRACMATHNLPHYAPLNNVRKIVVEELNGRTVN